MKRLKALVWGIIYFCTMDGFFRILEKTGSKLICTRLKIVWIVLITMKPHANRPLWVIIWNNTIHFQWFVNLVFANWICINVYDFNFSIPPNEMALYPNWLLLYVLRIIIPMLMLVIVAFKILIKSGRDIQREFDINLTSSLTDIYSVFS